MPVYRVMREAFRGDDGEYNPGLAWVYDGRVIRLAALPPFEPERRELQVSIDAALADGWHSDAIWAYHAEKGGQHYLSMRSRPEPLLAPDVSAALDAALASLR